MDATDIKISPAALCPGGFTTLNAKNLNLTMDSDLNTMTHVTLSWSDHIETCNRQVSNRAILVSRS